MARRRWGHELRAKVPLGRAYEPPRCLRAPFIEEPLAKLARAATRLLDSLGPVPALAPALAGAPTPMPRRTGITGSPTPAGPLTVAFARESAFDVRDPDDFESGLTAAELGEALDGVDFFGVLSSGSLDEPETKADAPGAGSAKDGGDEREMSLEDPAGEGSEAHASRADGPSAPIVCEATHMPSIGETSMERFTVRGRRHVAVVVDGAHEADAFLRVLAGLAPPPQGELWLFGHPLHDLSADERAEIRALVVGTLSDALPLIQSLTIEDNLLVAATGAGLGDEAARSRIDELAPAFSLHEALRRHPLELSATERWRARAARALLHRPAIVIADVTTRELDAKGRADVLGALGEALSGTPTTVVLACPGDCIPEWAPSRVMTRGHETAAPPRGGRGR